MFLLPVGLRFMGQNTNKDGNFPLPVTAFLKSPSMLCQVCVGFELDKLNYFFFLILKACRHGVKDFCVYMCVFVSVGKAGCGVSVLRARVSACLCATVTATNLCTLMASPSGSAMAR